MGSSMIIWSQWVYPQAENCWAGSRWLRENFHVYEIWFDFGSGSGYPVPEFVFWGTFSGFAPGPLEGRKTTSFRHSATMIGLSQLSSFESQVSLVYWYTCMYVYIYILNKYIYIYWLSASFCLVESSGKKKQLSTLKSPNSYWLNDPFLCLKPPTTYFNLRVLLIKSC